MTGDCFVFTFLRRFVDEKHLSRFQSETSVVTLRCVSPSLNKVNLFIIYLLLFIIMSNFCGTRMSGPLCDDRFLSQVIVFRRMSMTTCRIFLIFQQ